MLWKDDNAIENDIQLHTESTNEAEKKTEWDVIEISKEMEKEKNEESIEPIQIMA